MLRWFRTLFILTQPATRLLRARRALDASPVTVRCMHAIPLQGCSWHCTMAPAYNNKHYTYPRSNYRVKSSVPTSTGLPDLFVDGYTWFPMSPDMAEAAVLATAFSMLPAISLFTGFIVRRETRNLSARWFHSSGWWVDILQPSWASMVWILILLLLLQDDDIHRQAILPALQPPPVLLAYSVRSFSPPPGLLAFRVLFNILRRYYR